MNKELKLLLKLHKKKVEGGPVQSRGGVRVDANDEDAKRRRRRKGLAGVLFEGGGVGRIEVIVKMQEKKSEGEELARVDVNEIRIDVNEELKLL